MDLDKKCIEGYAVLKLTVHHAVNELVLDTRSLDIISVHHCPPDSNATTPKPGNADKLHFSLSEAHAVLGSALTIQLGSEAQPGDKPCVGIHFKVSEESTAAQFLAPAQTAGGKHPYLFTQCQAIHARSLVPCQDTPNVKMTYDAIVTVAAPLTAVMSAKRVPAAPAPTLSRFASSLQGEPVAFEFIQDVPIPSYLIALAVGELESRTLSERSSVWAEPSVVDAAAYEFAEVTQYMDAAEALAGPYRWGQYDLLLLPPSFPYGAPAVGRRSATQPRMLCMNASWSCNAARAPAMSMRL